MTNPAVPPAISAPQCPTWCTTKHKPSDYQRDQFGEWGVSHDSAPVTVRATDTVLRDHGIAVEVSLTSYECETPEELKQPQVLLALDGTVDSAPLRSREDAWLNADQAETLGYALLRKVAQLRAEATSPPAVSSAAPGCPAWCDDHTDGDDDGPALHSHALGLVPAHWMMGDVTGTEITLLQSGDGPMAVEVTNIHELDAAGCQQAAGVLLRGAAMVDAAAVSSPAVADATVSAGRVDGSSCPSWCSNHTDADCGGPAVHEHLIGTVAGHATIEGASGIDICVAQVDGSDVEIGVLGDAILDMAGARASMALLQQAIKTAESSRV